MGSTDEPLRIAAVLPLTGPEQLFGSQGLQGATAPDCLRAEDHHMILNMIIAEVQEGRLEAVQYVGPVAPGDQCAARAAQTERGPGWRD